MGWGALAGGGTDWVLAVAAAVQSGILGLLFALAYLAGRRSLWPVIIAHTGLNLVIEPWLVLAAVEGKMGG